MAKHSRPLIRLLERSIDFIDRFNKVRLMDMSISSPYLLFLSLHFHGFYLGL